MIWLVVGLVVGAALGAAALYIYVTRAIADGIARIFGWR